MIIKRLLQTFRLAFILFLFLPFSLVPDCNAQSSGYQIDVIESSGQKLVLHVSFSEPVITSSDDDIHQIITISDLYSKITPGAPQVPQLGIPFFIPIGAKVLIEWNGHNEHLTLNKPPQPSPSRQLPESGDIKSDCIPIIDKHDPLYYCDNRPYPQIPVILESDNMFFRNSRIGLITISPVIVNAASKQITFYNQVDITITFDMDNRNDRKVTRDSIDQEHEVIKSVYKQIGINAKALISGLISTRPNPLKPKMNHSRNPSKNTMYRITIHRSGIYCLTYTDLMSAGFPVSSVNPKNLALYKDGQEIAIAVIGQEDDQFNFKDRLIFYGQGIQNQYTDNNVYWLVDKGTPGIRMTTLSPTIPTSPEITTFRESISFETNTKYWANIPDGYGFDHWFWGDHLIAPTNRTINAVVSYPATVSTAYLYADFQGRSYSLDVNPDHHISLEFNNNPVGDHYWDGQTPSEAGPISVDPLYLINGMNQIKVILPHDTGALQDSIYINSFHLEYDRFLMTDSDELIFELDQIDPHRVNISGFSSDDISLYVISDPLSVSYIDTYSVIFDNGSYNLTFGHDSLDPQRYCAIDQSVELDVISIEADLSSSLKNTNNGADIIIVAPLQFHEALGPLVTHRQNQGYRVECIDIQNIYDEFSDGVFNPNAITDFIQYTFDFWQSPPPLALLLVGEANIDYHDYYGTGVPNIVPTDVLETYYLGQTISDYVFSLVSGNDDIPDLYIGRVTAVTSNDVASFVSRIIGYETQTVTSTWDNNILLVSDSGSTFESYLDSLETTYFDPYGYTTNKVYLDDYGPNVTQATQDIITNITTGRSFCFYLGHGSFENWSGQFMLDTADISQFDNGYRQPLLVASSCLNGYFGHHTILKVMGEEWIRYEDKGAIVTAASSSLNSEHDGNNFHHHLLEQILEFNEKRIGIAITNAEIKAHLHHGLSLDHVKTQAVLGDPMTILRTPHDNPEEIMRFDKEYYYTEDDIAILTLWDPKANISSFAIDTVAVVVSSDTDTLGFSLTLIETGNNTGIFTSDTAGTVNIGFSLQATDPPQGIIHINHGDSIYLEYTNGNPPQNHSSSAQWFLNTTPAINQIGIIVFIVLMGLILWLHSRSRVVLLVKK